MERALGLGLLAGTERTPLQEEHLVMHLGLGFLGNIRDIPTGTPAEGEEGLGLGLLGDLFQVCGRLLRLADLLVHL